MSPESVRILWQKTVDVFEQTEDWFSQFEGASKDSPIFVINDTAVDKGLQFRVTSRAGYYGPGKSGDSLFTTSADFETDVISNNTLQADYLRNAASATKRTDEFMGMQGELVDGQAEELGKWMGREKSARMGMMFVLEGQDSNNLIFAGGKASENLLKTADGVGYTDILLMGQALKPQGGKPAMVGTVRGSPVKRYIIAGTTPSLYSLKQDDDYKAILSAAGPRENYDENPLFSGGYMDLDGHIIKEFCPIDPDGYAWAGSWWNAKAYLGAAITAGTSTFAIKGGGSAAAAALTNHQYFRFFPNYAFEFNPEDVYVPDTSIVRYLLVIAPRGPVTAANPTPGGVGFYSFTTGNNGNQITILQRLGPASAGAMVSTLGGVTYNSGVWAGRTAENFPIGSTVVLANSFGVPIGDTIMFGAMTALRGYGKYRNWRTQWDVDGQFETRKYIMTVFGQKLRQNVNGKIPGYVRLRSAIAYPELGLPVVV